MKVMKRKIKFLIWKTGQRNLIQGCTGYPAWPDIRPFSISGIRPDSKFDIRPDIRPAGYPAGRISGAGYTGYIKYSNNKFLLQYWEINLGYEKKNVNNMIDCGDNRGKLLSYCQCISCIRVFQTLERSRRGTSWKRSLRNMRVYLPSTEMKTQSVDGRLTPPFFQILSLAC